MATEIDWGWIPDADGTKARLSWRESDGTVYLFHANTGAEEVLAEGVFEVEMCRFWEHMDESRPLTVGWLREFSRGYWPYTLGPGRRIREALG